MRVIPLTLLEQQRSLPSRCLQPWAHDTHGFEELFGGSTKKDLLGSETSWSHWDQPGPWASETDGCTGNSEGRLTAVQNLPSPAFSMLLLPGFPLHLRNPGEVLSLPTQLCKSTAQSHHMDFSCHAVSLTNPTAWGRFWKRDLQGKHS